MLWQSEENGSRCSHCGTYDWEWQAEDGTMKDEPYEADGWRCFGCKAVDRKMHDIEGAAGNNDGLKVRLFRTEG